MANVPLKWGIIGTDGKVEINGADDSVFSSSSPAFKVNGDGTVTGSFSIGGNGTITGTLTVSGANGISAVKITTSGDVTVGGSLSVTGNENLTGNLIMPPTATISLKGTKNTGKVISFIDNTASTDGVGISIGGGGPTVIGGGESADTLKAQVGTSGAEEMYIGNDGNVSIFSNLQTGWAARKTWTFGTNGTFTAQPGSGVTYIAGCGGSQSGIYVKKGSLNANQWIPGMTIQTKTGGGWAIGNYDSDSLLFVFGSKANIDSGTNTVNTYVLTTGGSFNITAADATKAMGYTNQLSTNNTTDTWVPVLSGTNLQHRAIPTDYNTAPTESATGSRIVKRSAAGYIYATYYNASCGDETTSLDYGQYMIYCNSDGWLRKAKHMTTVYSGTLKNGTEATWANVNAYSYYLIIGDLNGTENPLNSIVVSRSAIGTSASRWQYADESSYYSFTLWYSGTTGHIKGSSGTSANAHVKWVIGLN